jgi:hypothetical protein
MSEQKIIKRKRLLAKLLTINHLNVPERQVLGSSPTFSEMLDVASHYFQTSSFLPSVIEEWSDTKICYEGYSLEKNGESYILHLQVAGPALNLYVSKQQVFYNLKDGLQAFLQNEFKFNIDGIQILKDHTDNR